MNYWTKRDSLVTISTALRFYDWKIYGYKEDNSDFMTDYYDPERWDGIAVKNGYILVIDNSTGGTIGGNFVKKSYDSKLLKKIEKLKALRDCPSASAGEKRNASAIIKRLDKNLVTEIIVENDLPPVKFQANPNNFKWHIEKNGKIIAKGNGVFGFKDLLRNNQSSIVYKNFDDNSSEYTYYYNDDNWMSFYSRIKAEQSEQEIILDKFFSLINRWQKLVTIKIGEGDEETLVKKEVVKNEIYYIAKESKSQTDYVTVGAKWRLYKGVEKQVYKISENDFGKYITKVTKKTVKFPDGKYLSTYKQEPRKNTNSILFRGKDDDFENGDLMYIRLVKKVIPKKEIVWVKPSKRRVKK